MFCLEDYCIKDYQCNRHFSVNTVLCRKWKIKLIKNLNTVKQDDFIDFKVHKLIFHIIVMVQVAKFFCPLNFI